MNNHAQFSQYQKFMCQYVAFNRWEWQYFTTQLSVHRFTKGQCIHHAGDICTQLSFVNQGILRAYIIDPEGKDYTWNIFFNDTNAQMPNLYAIDYASFIKQTPSKLSIEVLDDCELISICYTQLQQLYKRFKKAERFGRLMAELANTYMHQLIIDRMTKSAPVRYQEFMQNYPHLLDKVPQYHIASFLDMTPQSLSRIKKNLHSLT